MRAAVFDRYGPPEVVRIDEVPRPEPRADEVLVRVAAAAVTSGDARIRAARFPPGFALAARVVFGVTRPRRRILGSACSGVVVTVGDRVAAFAPGDEVAAMTGTRMGAHAEYVAVPVQRAARKPAGVSHDEAAGVLFGGSTALWFLRDKATIGPGTCVLVNGASGAVGTNAVQLARRLGAEVTAVTSAANAPLVRDLGAVDVLDHHEVDVTTIDARFDVVLDAVGNLTIPGGRRLLAPDGRLLLVVSTFGEAVRARGPVAAGSAPERAEDFTELLTLVAAGELTVVVDRVLPLADIVDAHRRVDSGHKVGNVVVRP